MTDALEGIIREAPFGRGDIDGYFKLCTEDFAFHVPGHSGIAGRYVGKQGLYDLSAKAKSITGGILHQEVEGVLANDNYAVVVARYRFTRDGSLKDYRTAHVYEVRERKLAQCFEQPCDPASFEDAWGPSQSSWKKVGSSFMDNLQSLWNKLRSLLGRLSPRSPWKRLRSFFKSEPIQPPKILTSQLAGIDWIQLYGVYRDYLKHEDELINRRLSWNLTLQGFLFAAYGLVITKADELKGHLGLLRYLLPMLGVAVSSMSLIGIYAAQDAIKGLNSWWGNITECVKDSPDILPFPGLTGGGRDTANRLGKFAHYIPIPILGVWVLILLITFLDYLWQLIK
jgi:ketosteroid isomerase-like protein